MSHKISNFARGNYASKPALNFYRFCLFFGLLLIILIFLNTLTKGLNISSNLLSLLPNDREQHISNKAFNQLNNGNNHRVILLLTSDSLEALEKSLETLSQKFGQSQLWQIYTGSQEEDSFSTYFEFLAEHRFHLKTLDNQNIKPKLHENFQSLFLPGGWNNPLSFHEDPLNNFGDLIKQYDKNLNVERINHYFIGKNLDLEFGYLIVSPAKKLSLSEQQLAVEEIDFNIKTLSADVDVFRAGVIFHTVLATQTAKLEMAVISIVSIIAIVLIYIILFRSLIPLLATLVSIAIGIFSGFTLTHFLIGEIHILTLIFGASLIGISVDYSLHYFCAAYFLKEGHQEPNNQTVKHTLPGILLALFTTSIAYFCLTQANISILAQIATFSIGGLFFAFLAVFGLYPLIQNRIAKIDNRFYRIADFLGDLWQHPYKSKLLLVIFCLILIGMSYLLLNANLSSSIKSLYKPSNDLIDQAVFVEKTLALHATNQLVIVKGKSKQKLLENERILSKALEELVEQKLLTDYSMISDILPPIELQKSNFLQHFNALSRPASKDFLLSIGIEEKSMDKLLQTLSDLKERALTFDQWYQHAPEYFQMQYLGKVGESYYSFTTLNGIKNTDAIDHALAPLANIYYKDNVKSLSRKLFEISQKAIILIFIVYLVAALFLMIRYRKISSAMLLAPPLISSVLAMFFALALTGEISLFHIFGLYLILGLGLDYSIFLHESQRDRQNSPPGLYQSSMTAVTLSAVTSMLAFGLMSFSSNPMVSAFGMVILIGSISNLLFSSLVKQPSKQP